MARMDRDQARALIDAYGIPWRLDWVVLSMEEKNAVVAAADERGYQKPKNANGSRGRYFHAYLCRAMRSRA